MPNDSRTILARLDRRLGAPVAARAADFLADPAAEPVPPRASASVLLLRDTAGGLEVFVLHRHPAMPFAAGTLAFPGGGREPGDPTIEACAVREVAEETGVDLDEATLAPWAHWITPAWESRRYDTHFFLAALPAGATAGNASGEAEWADWVRPGDALVELAAGRWSALPPATSMITELVELRDVDHARDIAADRTVGTVLPTAVHDRDEGWCWVYPAAGSAGGRP
ncbi:NUDIX hydrolase [Microlunatus sp. Y2014]|uniref:NUDIX hydrolase n=1 Tax=Microlunatus sp. Y2014 TaxID=3418488 RepID=UPI003DA79434